MPDDTNQAYDRVEDFVDCAGKIRTFHVREELTPIGPILEARELDGDEYTGFSISEEFDLDDPSPPFMALRTRIRERLASRDLVRHPRDGHLEALTNKIRAQITRDERGLGLLVDGERYDWAELGELLEAYEGWGVRITICDAGRE